MSADPTPKSFEKQSASAFYHDYRINRNRKPHTRFL
jgi:hypothetical protein